MFYQINYAVFIQENTETKKRHKEEISRHTAMTGSANLPKKIKNNTE